MKLLCKERTVLIKGVLFDLDGTLLNTTEGVLDSAKYTAKKMGYNELPNEILIKFIGPPIQESFKIYYGSNSETAQKAANIFREHYKNEDLFKAVPYDGIIEFCNWLKNKKYRIAVATYKREDYALNLLHHFNFAKYCVSIHGADNENKLSKADIAQICIEEMACKRDEVVLIGDTEHDAVGAEKAGIKFIGVTYGFGFKTIDDVKAYKHIGYANNVSELYKFF
jgi:phosphoglycolate phosphatase